jgi:pimeloyl-ACP methyl ester carboxylesterase
MEETLYDIERIPFKVKGSEGKTITGDVTYPKHEGEFPVVIFCHGFKGFKDWGHWNQVAQFFGLQGCVFIKFNFSHNGVDPNDLTDLKDGESFAENTLSREKFDLEQVLKWVQTNEEQLPIDRFNINLIGHSRGAAIGYAVALEVEEVQRVISWAGVIDVREYLKRFDAAAWEENGFLPIVNARTGQEWRMNWTLMLDFLNEVQTWNLIDRASDLDAQLLMIHGDEDEAVSIEESRKVAERVPHAILVELEGAGHTFGSTHPPQDRMPKDLLEASEETLEFINWTNTISLKEHEEGL